MAISALLKFDQAGNPGVAGVALFGTLAFGAVTTSNGGVSTGATKITFELIDVPRASAITIGIKQSGMLATWTFTPDVAGSYFVRLLIQKFDSAGNLIEQSEDFRVFAVKNPSGRIAPPYRAEVLDVTHPELGPMNFDMGGGNLNKRGTAPFVEDYFTVIDSGGVSAPVTLTGAADVVELTVKGFAAQANPLQEWRDSTNALVAAISPAGQVKAASARVTGLADGVVHATAGNGTIASSTIVNADVNAAAAIAGSKISPDFGAQAVTTSGNMSTTGAGTLTSAGLATLASAKISNLGNGVVHATGGIGTIASSTIVNADVDAAAAIAGTKISPDFGSQNIVTTGDVTVGGASSTMTVKALDSKFGNGTRKAVAEESSKDDTTTTNARKVIRALALPDNAGTHVFVTVTAWQTGGAAGARADTWKGCIQGLYSRDTAGNVVLKGTAPAQEQVDGSAALTTTTPLTIDLTINTTTLEVGVTGATNKNLTWAIFPSMLECKEAA